MSQILHPKYMFFIGTYAIILFTLGITVAKYIDKIFEDFNRETNVKSRPRVWVEVLIQVVVSVLVSYILREFIDAFIRNVLGLEKHIYGNPDRFAVIIVAPTMFYTQVNLQKKMIYLWNLTHKM